MPAASDRAPRILCIIENPPASQKPSAPKLAHRGLACQYRRLAAGDVMDKLAPTADDETHFEFLV